MVVEMSNQPALLEIERPTTKAGGTDMMVNTTSAYGGKKVTRQSPEEANRISFSVMN